MAEQKPHTELIRKFESLTDELRDYLKTIKRIKEENPQDNIRDLLVAYKELKETVDEIKGELIGIGIIQKINVRAMLSEVPEGFVSKTGMSRQNQVERLRSLKFGGRKTRKHRKRR
jgi:gentisate 1,2-dioxygenase